MNEWCDYYSYVCQIEFQGALSQARTRQISNIYCTLMSDVEKDPIPSKKDANDYSRFNFSDDDDDDAMSPSPPPTLIDLPTFHENLHRAIQLKEAGNAAFKLSNLDTAKQNYDEALLLLKPLRGAASTHLEITADKRTELNSTFISVLSNKGIVLFKEEKWTEVIPAADEVLSSEPDNIKALYRRSVAHHRTGYFEESKIGLSRVLELDESNKPAKKELIDVLKAIKEKKQREKASMSSAFSSGSMYSDKEAERLRKIRLAQEEEERLQDEWIQDKLKRRKEGEEEEISFENWKKQKKKREEVCVVW